MHVRPDIFGKHRTALFKVEFFAIPLRHIIVFFGNDVIIPQFRCKDSEVHTYAFAAHDTPYLILIVHQHPRQRMDNSVLAVQIAMRHVQGHHIVQFLRHIRVLRIITVAFVIEYRFLRILVAPFESLHRNDRLLGQRHQILFQPERAVAVILTQPIRIYPRVRHYVIAGVHDLIGSQHDRQQVVSHETVQAAALVRIRQIFPVRIETFGIFPHVVQRTDSV